MNINIEEKKELKFIGFHTNILPNEGYEKCPEFWEKEYSQRFARLWQTMKPENDLEKAVLDNMIGMYAICVDHENNFDYWIAGLYKGGEVPKGLDIISFDKQKWAVFKTMGPLVNSLQSLNKYICSEWYPKEGIELKANMNLMIEEYSAGNQESDDYECGIWVPVKGK